ncbi:hypothetical protein [Aureibacter tunicatorum]|uniref:Uncharacterized protein n=1 Tax=Aureibacter tunicatorum TaxID=866807 RepID=A0AAE3XR88_9BACT|nr:hypothetical protein [Aureibacter tunicatorum]MDR6241205.1 hypothetical protein [Aureibacter tunicatorum]BDD03980.1 hypothetical protein AUTU_14630 [Aureibacter tunicatorum]
MIDRLKINYRLDSPSEEQIIKMWKDLKLTPLSQWSDSTEKLRLAFEKTHCNGGIQLHKFQISDNPHFHWFAVRNRLDEINFIKKLFQRPELKHYRKALKVENDKLKIKSFNWYSDIFDLSGIFARILGQGGAYENLDAIKAWEVSTDFVKNEFGNRFDEFNRFSYETEGANWFCNIAWDYSFLLFDKRNNQVILIDVTDTD